MKRTPHTALALLVLTSALAGLGGLPGCNPGTDSYPSAQEKPGPKSVQAAPISGGTLVALRDGSAALASDPDRDTVSIVDLATSTLKATIQLEDHDEPGRLVEDGAGRVHVALRRGGAVITIDVKKGVVVDRRPVCAAPRGLAYDAPLDSIHVACAGGELVTLPASAGAATRTLRLDRDLRDVVVSGANLLVSRFRAAEILTVTPSGEITARRAPAAFDTVPDPSAMIPGAPKHFEPAVAWRMVAVPGGSVMMVHQRAQSTLIDLAPTPTGNPYLDGSGCNGTIVQTTVTEFPDAAEGTAAALELPSAALPVDLAVSPDGATLAVVAAGSNALFEDIRAEFLATTSGAFCNTTTRKAFPGGPIAVTFDPKGRTLVQTRNPSAVFVDGHEIDLALMTINERPAQLDPGRETFHTPPNGTGSLACASCHPEGRDDGRVWLFAPMGARRTQSLAGDVTQTAPFHWGGELPTFDDLMLEVFVRRMGGSNEQVFAHGDMIKSWLATIPAPPASPPLDPAAVKRGSALFHDASVGCVTCHAGDKGTNNQTVDVGTGAPLQVPWLVGVAWRAPFLHDGCAATLKDRFGACGGGDKHGNTSQLSSDQIDDLVAYLETL